MGTGRNEAHYHCGTNRVPHDYIRPQNHCQMRQLNSGRLESPNGK